MGDTTTTIKKCSCCKMSKERSEFYTDRRRKDGLQAYCKPCLVSKKKKAEYSRTAPKPTPKGVELAKQAIDVVEALPSNNYNIHKAYASVSGKDITKSHTYTASNQLWDNLADDESALTLFRSYITNDINNIDLRNSFTRYFLEAMQNGSLGEKNSALSLTFKVLGWMAQKTEGSSTKRPKTPDERKREREDFLLSLDRGGN